MDERALQVAREVAARYIEQAGGDLIDGNTLVRATMAGYLAASGVPTDEAVARVERMAVKNLVGPVPPNPMFHGLPWMVPGPVSGAPYYR
ncbi:alpha-D-ribose 1-methylphosphonate 5-triphosphate synthase subunit PhnI [Symbiobacterium terraclitae]|uniref:Alpha-D-ribose 1-methylphosphonate 5-triphosphate synthase subunit PhnI n=1 Tax=Symbiobacterium terraclitae TaxID=557451 RepID=A0ABS4JTZ9_9FIRM|nr:hypothetical protein [Symbiobacterium terraclitae]MBP2019008.1 alpha-D-ribose 1-methylphosphonate 5-triphosphate synthase subunit PhnI [Symbiobacterium terraclitae]